MREPGVSLTPAGPCSNPRCDEPTYRELSDPALGDFPLCVDCEEVYGDRLREKIAEAEGRPLCTEACCRRRAA